MDEQQKQREQATVLRDLHSDMEQLLAKHRDRFAAAGLALRDMKAISYDSDGLPLYAHAHTPEV